MYDDGIEEVEFPTPICPITEPHAKHRIPGTWRDECPGVQGPEIQHDATGDYPCTKCGHRGITKVTTPGCNCIGCEDLEIEDTEIKAETARLMRAGWRNPAAMAASNVARRRARQGAQDVPQRRPERNKCVHGFWIQGGIETCPDGCTKTLADETEQWIAEQVGQLSEGELLMLKGVLDDIAAGRPVEHFEAGTKVYANTWGTTEFIVQGTAPWHENGVVSRKVEIRSASGNLTGHVAPSELRRVS